MSNIQTFILSHMKKLFILQSVPPEVLLKMGYERPDNQRLSKKYPLPTRSGVQMIDFVSGSGFRQHDVGTFVGMGKI
jgi:hypothetical protein